MIESGARRGRYRYALTVALLFGAIACQPQAELDGASSSDDSSTSVPSDVDSGSTAMSNYWQHPAPPFIEGYADKSSVEPGGVIRFMVSTSEPVYSILVYRLSLYSTPLLIESGLTGVEQSYPADSYAAGCGWAPSYELTVPLEWTSGPYLARLDVGGGNFSTIFFVVRSANPGQASNMLFQCSTNTYQAYNNWGGKSLYSTNSSSNIRSPRVTYDRPYALNSTKGSGEFYFWEANMARFLENQGIHPDYCTNVDLHQDATLLSHYDLFMSVGHDEYWSAAMYDQAEQHRDAGRSLAFFGANNVYWRVDFESGDRVMFVEKFNNAYWWRNQGRPEAALVGIAYTDGMLGTGLHGYRVLQPGSAYLRLTGLKLLQPLGQYSSFIGHEGDEPQPESPANLKVIGLNEDISCTVASYVAPSGAQVFAAGTIAWSYGLDTGDPIYARGIPDAKVQQTTLNIIGSLARPALQRGDCNCDGSVDLADRDVLRDAIRLRQTGWEARYPCSFFVANDMDFDGDVDIDDLGEWTDAPTEISNSQGSAPPP
ncbi:MAG: hypothetical protein CHACPFDD_00955 [Phycisphaerae bacterium]|nr:hypothetical protein [Phycisphaerae bacterium]